MAGNGWKWLEIAGMAEYWLKRLEMAGNGWKGLEMGYPYKSFGDLGSTGYENWEIGNF